MPIIFPVQHKNLKQSTKRTPKRKQVKFWNKHFWRAPLLTCLIYLQKEIDTHVDKPSKIVSSQNERSQVETHRQHCNWKQNLLNQSTILNTLFWICQNNTASIIIHYIYQARRNWQPWVIKNYIFRWLMKVTSMIKKYNKLSKNNIDEKYFKQSYLFFPEDY